jgi:hypothetical protein
MSRNCEIGKCGQKELQEFRSIFGGARLPNNQMALSKRQNPPGLGDVARPTYAPSRGPARNPGSAPLKALGTVSRSFGSLP